MKEKIKEALRSATDDIFLEWQAKLHIISGDVEPLMCCHFDTLLDELSKQMVSMINEMPKLGITHIELLDGRIINLSDKNLGYDEVQKLAEVEKALREKEII